METMQKAELREHTGWMGLWTDSQAPGCYPNGTRVVKAGYWAGDGTPTGTAGTVLGSLRGGAMAGYFVEWDNRPRMAVFVEERKVMRVQ